jgi:hypothetical protein
MASYKQESLIRTLNWDDQNPGRHPTADGDSTFTTGDQQACPLALDDLYLGTGIQAEVG